MNVSFDIDLQSLGVVIPVFLVFICGLAAGIVIGRDTASKAPLP